MLQKLVFLLGIYVYLPYFDSFICTIESNCTIILTHVMSNLLSVKEDFIFDF
jgi:hypothetical protein